MITEQQIHGIAATCNELGVSDDTIGALRQQYPKLHFTYCMDDDLPNHSPVLEQSAFNVYLVDGREHCLCLTQEYAHATGVVIAEIIAD